MPKHIFSITKGKSDLCHETQTQKYTYGDRF